MSARGMMLSATSSAGGIALITENNGATWETRQKTAGKESHLRSCFRERRDFARDAYA